MAWVWRKVFRFGPIRTTMSTRGWGWSIGLPFLRYGVGPSGARYVSIGIPGTGLYFTKFLTRQVAMPVLTTPNLPSHTNNPNVSSIPTLSANQKILDAIRNNRKL
ncbi:MAG: DUF4236 domain-containing protein [Rhodospirillales bacterium]